MGCSDDVVMRRKAASVFISVSNGEEVLVEGPGSGKGGSTRNWLPRSRR